MPQVASGFITISTASLYFLSLPNPLFLKSPAQPCNVINTVSCLHRLSFHTICRYNLKSSNAWGSRPLSFRKLKNNRAKSFCVVFFFFLSALLYPRVDIFLAFQLWMFLKRHELHNKVTIQKQGFIDNPLSTSRRGWLVICSTWNRSKKFKSVLQREKYIYLRIPELEQCRLYARDICSSSLTTWKAVSNLEIQAGSSWPALPPTQDKIFSPPSYHSTAWPLFGLHTAREKHFLPPPHF